MHVIKDFFGGGGRDMERVKLTGLHELSLASKHLGESGMAAGEGVLHGCPTDTRC